MPLFYQKNLNEYTKLAIWRISEPEEFFREKVNISRNISHPKKRVQHLAGRYLLQYLEPNLPIDEILLMENGKPYLRNNNWFVSISHCSYYAGVIISQQRNVGIDLEVINTKTRLIRHKFLNEFENEYLLNHHQPKEELKLLTLFWSAKEAMFKWYGKGQVDFKENLLLREIDAKNKTLSARFQKESTCDLTFEYRFFGDLCAVWTF